MSHYYGGEGGGGLAILTFIGVILLLLVIFPTVFGKRREQIEQKKETLNQNLYIKCLEKRVPIKICKDLAKKEN